MAANYAIQQYTYQNAAGASVTIEAGSTRDSVTDAAVIAVWPANWTATVPTPSSHHPRRVGWLSVYPRGTVS